MIVRASSLMPVSFRPEIIAPVGGGSILTISMITNEALRIFENEMKFTTSFAYDDRWSNSGIIGDTLRIHNPPRFAI